MEDEVGVEGRGWVLQLVAKGAGGHRIPRCFRAVSTDKAKSLVHSPDTTEVRPPLDPTSLLDPIRHPLMA